MAANQSTKRGESLSTHLQSLFSSVFFSIFWHNQNQEEEESEEEMATMNHGAVNGQQRGAAFPVCKLKAADAPGDAKNRKALEDFGNLVNLHIADGKPITRPIARSFGAQLLAKAQAAAATNKNVLKQVAQPADGATKKKPTIKNPKVSISAQLVDPLGVTRVGEPSNSSSVASIFIHGDGHSSAPCTAFSRISRFGLGIAASPTSFVLIILFLCFSLLLSVSASFNFTYAFQQAKKLILDVEKIGNPILGLEQVINVETLQ